MAGLKSIDTPDAGTVVVTFEAAQLGVPADRRGQLPSAS